MLWCNGIVGFHNFKHEHILWLNCRVCFDFNVSKFNYGWPFPKDFEFIRRHKFISLLFFVRLGLHFFISVSTFDLILVLFWAQSCIKRFVIFSISSFYKTWLIGNTFFSFLLVILTLMICIYWNIIWFLLKRYNLYLFGSSLALNVLLDLIFWLYFFHDFHVWLIFGTKQIVFIKKNFDYVFHLLWVKVVFGSFLIAFELLFINQVAVVHMIG